MSEKLSRQAALETVEAPRPTQPRLGTTRVGQGRSSGPTKVCLNCIVRSKAEKERWQGYRPRSSRDHINLFLRNDDPQSAAMADPRVQLSGMLETLAWAKQRKPITRFLYCHEVMLDRGLVAFQPVPTRKSALLGRIWTARHVTPPRLAMFVAMLPG
ncbi:hypothetical protein M440DRAFT_1219182 [Trichoderma longibrachiatum ATCC 18648]|uniref:Uncharacterized protein n=1 Tax=Trichoderma longibrachiatum ATCC 18648 TaxID=983965 RepID=A0A2T4C812_TRILO|nr:hypothetical protein M440DRAFT_1219182 [Trichoderma longibrachiatum ATCC 18648]